MKILASDFDGTFAHNGITEEKLDAVTTWQKSGNKFGIVTGRGITFRDELLPQFPQLTLDFFAMCNGAYVADENGNAIYEARCADLPIKEFAADLLAWGCKFIHVNGKQYACIVADRQDRPHYIDEADTYFLATCPPFEYFYQVSVALPTDEETLAVIEKFQNKYADRLNLLQNGHCLDMVPTGCNKAQGVYRAMEFFGCTREDVITVGDNLNDADMIREFRSYAMQQGQQEIRDLASGVVSDVTELIDKEL